MRGFSHCIGAMDDKQITCKGKRLFKEFDHTHIEIVKVKQLGRE